MIEKVSPRDRMWEGDRVEYFEIAASGGECVRRAVQAAGAEPGHKILDFGCGHGRVMRALRAGFPDAELTACDIDEDGVRFCVDTFGARGIVADRDLTQIALPGTHDAIWCGSVLTHMDVQLWKQLLERFTAWLDPEGVVVFTTHGPAAAHVLRTGHWDYGLRAPEARLLLERYDSSGFGYVDYPRQTGYGLSICKPDWVRALLAELDGLRLLAFEDLGWTGHQDVFTCVREFRPT